MPMRNVVPTDRQETLIEISLQSGRYQDASEGLRAAALAGVSAFDRGAYKEFAAANALRVHLQSLAASGARDE